jgi:zinc protease
MPRFGRANLLGVFALFDDDPGRINTILDELEKVTVEDVKAAAAAVARADEPTSIDSRPGGEAGRAGRCSDDVRRMSPSAGAFARAAARCWPAARLLRAPRRCRKPDRPSAPSGRSRRRRAWSARLSNGLRVIAVRYATVPKLFPILTVQSGLAVDPAREGRARAVRGRCRAGRHDHRDSEQIKRESVRHGRVALGLRRAGLLLVPDARAGRDAAADAHLLSDVVRNPDVPAAGDRSAQGQHRAAAAGAAGLAAVRRQPVFRQTLFGTHPYARIGRREETLPAIDRARIVEYHKTYYRPEQRIPRGHRRRGARRRFAAAEKAFGGWARGTVPAPKTPPAAALNGRDWCSCSGRTACSRPSRWATSRSAGTIRGGTRCSWPTRSTAPRSIRGWSATSARRRATPTRRSRFQAMGQAGSIAPWPTCATT